ncbi:MAG: DUF58 domain-containing protein [Myxococcales bacterium]|nr:MAG: DUF58 domain-containing protein [Myxococcales bacterium]
MSAPPAILNPDLVAKIGNLKIRARSVVDGVLTGLHKSPHHGSSIEFAEHKEYSPGDEIRHIDWRAYARFDRYYVKKFEDETNLRAYLLVDGSASMGYGEGERTKLEYAKVLAAALAYLLLRQQDAAGMAAFRERLDFYIPPRAATGHYHELAAALAGLAADGKTKLVDAVEQAAELLRGRNLVVVFSDFFDPADGVLNLLARLRARKNEVALFHVLHGDELDFPFDALAEFEDMEDGSRLLADPDVIRREYRAVFGEFAAGLRQGCLAHGVDYVLARTDRPPETALLSLLQNRGGEP